MTAHIGDEVIVMSHAVNQPVRAGEIRGIRDDPGGAAYLVQWADTGHESLLPAGPDVVIKHPHGRGSGKVSAVAAGLLSSLRHPLAWRHRRDLERLQHRRDELLAGRVHDIIVGLGLTHADFSIGGGRVLHVPDVVAVAAGPPVRVDIRMLPGQTSDDFAARAQAIAYNLGVARVRIVPLGPSRIRLELLPSQ